MNVNLKLILLGLLAMVVTFLVFSAIEAAFIQPRIAADSTRPPSWPVTQAASVWTVQPTLTNAPTVRTSTLTPRPALLLTLPGEPFSPTSTLTSLAGLTGTPVSTMRPESRDTLSPLEDSEHTPTVESPQATGITPTHPNIPAGSVGIHGRVLFNSSLFSGTVMLKLVDPALDEIQQFTFMDGEYSIQNLKPSAKGYQVVFDREDNLQLSQNQVVYEVAVGPLPAEEGDYVRFPDFDIALLGLELLEPEPNEAFTAHPITPQQPLRFVWSEYQGLSQYRVELRRAMHLAPIWTSGYLSSESVVFDGVLANAELISRGTYWWVASARSNDGVVTVIGPPNALVLDW
jgi:hypothetical protein